jgi:hypothetical protein
MLTEKATHERMWGWIPALGKLLGSKRISDHHFGHTSVSDNAFDQVNRLMKISILIEDNIDEIKGYLSTSSEIRRDLYTVADALEFTAQRFRDAREKLINSIQ